MAAGTAGPAAGGLLSMAGVGGGVTAAANYASGAGLFSVKGAFSTKAVSFTADLAIQGVSLNAQGKGFGKNYNVASGVTALLFSNPFTSNTLSSGITVSRKEQGVSFTKGIVLGLLGGKVQSALGPLGKYLNGKPGLTLTSMYGETTTLPSIMGVSADFGSGIFTESTKAVGGKLLEDK